MTRIRLKIGRVTSQARGIDRAALETALRDELRKSIGSGAMTSSVRGLATADVTPGQGGLAPRVAQAAVKAVKT